MRASWNKYGRKNAEQRNARHRENYRVNPEKTARRVKAYQSTPRGKAAIAKAGKTQRDKFPEKVHARQQVRLAIARGDLIRKPCEVCGAERSQAHHDDYQKPLDVKWFCQPHHVVYHRSLKKEE